METEVPIKNLQSNETEMLPGTSSGCVGHTHPPEALGPSALAPAWVSPYLSSHCDLQTFTWLYN